MVNQELVRQLDELKKAGPRRMPPPKKPSGDVEPTEAQSAFEFLAAQVKSHNERIARLEREAKKPQYEDGVPTVEQMAEKIKHLLCREDMLTEIYYFLFSELGESGDLHRYVKSWENARKLWEQLPTKWWHEHRWMKMKDIMLIVRNAVATERLILEWQEKTRGTQ